MKLLRGFLLTGLLTVFLLATYYFFLKWYWHPQLQQRLRSALAGFSYRDFILPADPVDQPEVFGFLPYWTMQEAQIPESVTDVAYFAVTFDAQGELVAKTEDGYLEGGYARLQKEEFTDWLIEQKNAGRRAHITIVGQGNESISELVKSPKHRQEMIQNIKQLLISYPFDGLQLDLEIAGFVEPVVRSGLTNLTAELDKMMADLDPQLQLSIAVFGTAASNPEDVWDIAALDPFVDRFIIMSYDYHVRSSDVAGPVAPLFGKETGRYQDDITSNLRDFIKQTAADKILLGVPFYGYEWQVTEGEPGAATYPKSGSTATYQRIQELLADEENKIEEGWDQAALSPYLVYQENGKQQLIYYDDSRSLSFKLDLVNQLGMRGIAIWALGYEGDLTELWQVISLKLN